MYGGSSPWKGTRRVTHRDESSAFLPWQVSQLQSHATVKTPAKCLRFQEGFSSFMPCCSQSHPDFSRKPANSVLWKWVICKRSSADLPLPSTASNTEVSALAQTTSGAGSLTAGQQLSPNKLCTTLATTQFVGSTGAVCSKALGGWSFKNPWTSFYFTLVLSTQSTHSTFPSWQSPENIFYSRQLLRACVFQFQTRPLSICC